MTRLAVFAVVCCLFSWLLCNINPDKCYSWYAGIWHGLFIVPNFVRHIFVHSVLVKAECHTTAYNVFYWIFGVLGVIGDVGALFGRPQSH